MLDLWSQRIVRSVRDQIDEILQAPPPRLYLIASGAFDDLRIMAQRVIDGNLERGEDTEDRFTYGIEIPMYAIGAYCDLHTSIDTSCVVELMQAVYLEITNDKVAEGIPTEFGSKRSKKEILHLANQMLIVGVRFGNRLYAMASPSERAGIDEAKRERDQIISAILRIGRIDRFTWAERANRFNEEFPDYRYHKSEGAFRSKYEALCKERGIDRDKKKPGRPKGK